MQTRVRAHTWQTANRPLQPAAMYLRMCARPDHITAARALLTSLVASRGLPVRGSHARGGGGGGVFGGARPDAGTRWHCHCRDCGREGRCARARRGRRSALKLRSPRSGHRGSLGALAGALLERWRFVIGCQLLISAMVKGEGASVERTTRSYSRGC